ncbi:MAG: YwiC-like family protein [Gemmatimonadota bacterium]|nr:YwiC-like family protein [Gemmatimonadota bacterium]
MTSARLLFPREHGAYAELAFPLLTGLLCAPPRAATVAFALAASMGFLAHEPLAVATGTRGARRRAALGRTAERQLGWLLAGVAAAGLIGLVMGTQQARLATLVPAACVVTLGPWIVRDQLKTIAAELVVVGAFAATVIPLSVSSGRDWSFGWTAAWVWFASLSLGTVAVHALKARHKKTERAEAATWLTMGLAVLALAMTVGAAALRWTPWLAVLALVPPGVFTLVLGSWSIHTRHLKRVGWSLVAANAVTLACLLAI